jgi:hypothetical protein
VTSLVEVMAALFLAAFLAAGTVALVGFMFWLVLRIMAISHYVFGGDDEDNGD